ncbi:hypothetical protein K3495_g10773 [Podosphaera aphanis]|nr:hypothetical protein K3495_g10773 [Podosphaera aphanis]
MLHLSLSLMRLFIVLSVDNVFGHGLIDEIRGANNVKMPALQVIDGTPRDCGVPRCGAEADTSIIRDRELGTEQASALGRTNGGGPVDPSRVINIFMGPTNNDTVSQEARDIYAANSLSRSQSPILKDGGAITPKGIVENGVLATAGVGATFGLPTCSDDGKVTVNFHQVNGDGAGPLSADLDPVSGGLDPAAFLKVEIIRNVPGIGLGGLSNARFTDFLVEIQLPPDIFCSGIVGPAINVCILRIRNAASAGPFGGSVLFIQNAVAAKRTINYNLTRRRFARKVIMKA